MFLHLLATLACTDGEADPAVVDNDLDGFFADVDCDDDDDAIHPDALEVCDGLDNNCDDQIDEGVLLDFYPDADGDGDGDAGASAYPGCESTSGMVDNADDCDDTNPDVHPGADEVCNGVDDDCDGLTDAEDDGLDLSTLIEFYGDDDGDGYGEELDVTKACTAPEGYVDNAEDCNDALEDIHPDADEVCDGLDNDCDGLVDGDDDSIDPGSVTEFYADVDVDGYGDDGNLVFACELVEGLATEGGDCDDADADVNPGAEESCSETDSNCDGDAWAGATDAWFHADGDGSWTEADLSGWTGTEAGTLYVCENTFSADIALEADIDIIGLGEELSVLDGGGSRTILTIETDSLTVDISGVSFDNGSSSTVDPNFGYDVGGALVCFADSAVTISDSAFHDNLATDGLGGAIASDGCDLLLDSVEISGSSATFGGALFGFSGTIDLVDSEVFDNSAVSGGVYYGYGLSTPNEIHFTDSSVYENEAQAWGGALMLDASTDATCSGTTTSAAGFWDNTANSAGGGYGGGAVIVFASDATFEADICDFGTVAGDDDNSPDDIYTDTGAFDTGDSSTWGYAYDEDVTVSCTADGCE